MPDTQSSLTSPLDDLDSLTSVTESVAQDLVSQAAAEMGKTETALPSKEPEEKPLVAPISPVMPISVEEHPINEVDAQKFAGAVGDYAMPVSPLDDLNDLTPKAGPVPVPVPMPVSQEEQKKTDVIRPLETKDLEKKAQAMLNDFGPPSPPPKKKGSPAAKMALAAVMIVLMGAGGLVGVNLLRTNQSADNRSQAVKYCENDQYYDPVTDTCRDNPVTCNEPGHSLQNGVCDWIPGCRRVSWGVSCGGSIGDPCAPDLTLSGDHCIENGISVSCRQVGMMRCNCGTVWVIGSVSSGDNCYSLCGNSNAVCESCDEPPDNPDGPTPTPSSEFACTGIKPGTAVGDIKIGTPVDFTCVGSGGASRAEFIYTVDGGTAISIPTSTANPLKSNAVTFTKTGKYAVKCKVCKTDGTCSEYGSAQ